MSPGERHGPSTMDTDLARRARSVLDTDRYLVLGTVDPDGAPRVSPVYFTHHGYRDLFWVSRPDTHHSGNLGRAPVSGLVFDSSARVGRGQAVYVTGAAAEVAEAELADACEVAFARLDPEAHAFTPAELSGAGSLRLYRLRVERHEVHVGGSDPEHGTGRDRRVEVDLSGG